MTTTPVSAITGRSKNQKKNKPVGKVHHPQRKDALGGFDRLAELSSLTGATAPSGPMLDGPESDRDNIEMLPTWDDESVESLPELEREIGIADWIDPQTGEPAEGQSPPHLNAE